MLWKVLGCVADLEETSASIEDYWRLRHIATVIQPAAFRLNARIGIVTSRTVKYCSALSRKREPGRLSHSHTNKIMCAKQFLPAKLSKMCPNSPPGNATTGMKFFWPFEKHMLLVLAAIFGFFSKPSYILSSLLFRLPYSLILQSRSLHLQRKFGSQLRPLKLTKPAANKVS